MRFLPLLLCASALLGLSYSSIRAAVPVPKKPTLAQALSAAPPPAGGLLLTVSPETVTLPDGADAPPAGANFTDVASAFGDQTVAFGTVTAIAPATMVLLNTQPDTPDLSADLNPMTALSLLAASLDDAQWQALTSEHGLGLADLSDDTQRGLFHALMNHDRLWIRSEDPAFSDLPQEQRPDVRDVSDQIDDIRLRLGQTAHIYLHDRQGKTIYWSAPRPDAANRLHTFRPKTLPSPTEHNVTLRAVVANTLKPSDLDFGSKAFQVPVPTAGLKTVGDLVTRIGQTTGLELYADPHYAAKTLTIAGTASAAPASDLLQAVSLCVTGTFRKVGPAYVLTDDLLGIGVRRKHLAEWEQEATDAGSKLRAQAGSTLMKRRLPSARALPAYGDPLAVTPEQMAALPDDSLMPGIPEGFESAFPFAKLTPAQQAWMRQAAASYDEKLQSGTLISDDEHTNADLSRDVDLRPDLQVQMLLPSENTPIDTNLHYPIFMLYWPGEAELMDKVRSNAAEVEAKELAKLPPAPPLPAMLHLGRRRAVQAHPRTAKDVDALMVSMQKLGLNALFLDVFSNGVNHVKTSAMAGNDILTEALNRTHGTGIAVYADISLLSWGDAPPEGVRDLTIDGQTNREAAIQESSKNADENVDDDGKPIPFAAPSVQVSPAASAVRSQLTALMQVIAARPGLAGFVWEDAEADDDLGYTSEMRLAFLRTVHADPVDITTQNYIRADDTLPLFDDEMIDKSVSDRWEEARAGANGTLLVQLYADARRSGIVLPILMEQNSFRDHWLTSWDDPRQEPPPMRDLTPGLVYPPEEKVLRIALTQGQIVLRREAVENDGDTTTLARKLQDDAKTFPTDGFVLDFQEETVTQGAAPLDSLVRAVSANKTVK